MSTSGSDRERASRIPAALRAEQIHVVAQELALEKGLSAVTQRAVAARAGVAAALVAHYAPSMNALVADAFSAIVAKELSEVRAHLSAVRNPVARLQTLLSTALDGSRDDVTPIWVEAWSLGRRIPELASAVTEQMQDWHDTVVDVLEAGVDAEAFRAENLDSIAWQTLGMIDGLNAHEMVGYRQEGSPVGLIGRALEHELGLPAGSLTA